jgi:hypothetical protein
MLRGDNLAWLRLKLGTDLATHVPYSKLFPTHAAF